MNNFGKIKNAVALATANVARREIDLRIAKNTLEAAQKVLNEAIALSGQKALYIVREGERRIEVIKAIRDISNLSFKDAKDVVDGVAVAPAVIHVHVEPHRIDDAAKQLRAAGATVEVR